MDAAGIRSAATGSGGIAIFHLVRKCEQCRLDAKAPKKCFNKGHEQLLRTVRISESGTTLECVASGEVLAKSNNGDKFYYMLKPGSRVFAWDENNQIVEIPWADIAGLESLALAEGSVLVRSVPTKGVMSWLGHTSARTEVEDYPFPSRVASTRPTRMTRSPGWEWVDDAGSAPEDGEDGSGESREEAVRKRKEPLQAAPAGEQHEDGASQKAAKRRASSRPGAGVRVSPVGSGGILGEVGASGADGGAAQAPSQCNPATKDEVHQMLTGKLRACDKRELELKAVIEKATTELRKNSECRKAAIAESERQLLYIIAQREAKAAHYEQLAAQARAQNSSDRESLLAHKEQVQNEVGGKDVLVTVGGSGHKAGASPTEPAAPAGYVGHRVVMLAPGGQVESDETVKLGKGFAQVQKDRGAGLARASGAGVTGSSSWSIGAQAARLAQAQSVQAQVSQAPSAQTQSAQAPNQAAIAVQPPSTTSAEAGAAATASPGAPPPQPLLGGNKTQLEAEKARVREKLHQVQKELLHLENKETVAEAQPRPAAPLAPAVVRLTASPPAGLLAGDKNVPDVSGGMARTNTDQASFASGTATRGSAAVSVTDASPAVAAPAATPSDNHLSNESAMVADVSRAVVSAAAPPAAPASAPAATPTATPPAAPASASSPVIDPATCMRIGQQVVSPGGDGGATAPGWVEQRLQPHAGGKMTATAETSLEGGALRQSNSPSTLAIASSATPIVMGQECESDLTPSTNGGGLNGSQAAGTAKATAAAGTAAAPAAVTATAQSNGNAIQSKNDANKTLHLADLFAARGP